MTAKKPARPPHTLVVDFDFIPEVLKTVSNWVCWYWSLRNRKWTKPPVDPRTGGPASTTDPSTWGSIVDAHEYAKRHELPGIGIVPPAGMTVLDLDHCRDPTSGALDSWAQDIVDILPAYWEVSPSGTGLRALVYAQKPDGRCRKIGFEIYAGGGGRYVTITGHRLSQSANHIPESQDGVDQLHTAMFPTTEPTEPAAIQVNADVDLDDATLLDRMFSWRNGPAIRSLWEGDTSAHGGDDSAADLALLNHFRFATGADAGRMERMFTESALGQRSKWRERPDYRERSIQTALQGGGVYNPGIPLRNGRAAGDTGESATLIEPMDLAETIKTFQHWLHLPDPGIVYVMLAAIVANMTEGDPLWLLIIGPPGGGKTEVLQSISTLPRVHLAATLTEPALLSGTPKRQTAGDSKGGLLRVIGDHGILLLKDFGSILSMHRDARSAVLAALREIYDGSWTRHLGTDGGRTLSWSGKLGLIAGCTPTIDTHHAVLSALGERFLNYRLPRTEADRQALRALGNIGQEKRMRADLMGAVNRFFASLYIPTAPPEFEDGETNRLVELATLAVRCRSAVERDPMRREIELIPEPEAPGRMALALARLYAGLSIIGLPRRQSWFLITKVALDCMPATRREIIDVLLSRQELVDTTTIATEAGYPTVTSRRILEDLTAHSIVERHPEGQGKTDRWALTPWALSRLQAANQTFSEMSHEEEKL